ncbi:MAG: TetR/AcrR family transcriptional regulator [Bacteroidales bacterium]|nr:TetR/AcrR family transcriptional regulator [Candidatus Sodaliphilus aphodohippi]
MEIKQRIVGNALRLLKQVGPTVMTMDMVARECGMSKRTLYEVFADKKTLILECLRADHDRNKEQVKEIFRTAENCFDALLQVFVSWRKFLNETPLSFIDEINRLYPEISLQNNENERQHIHSLAKVLSCAQTQGLVVEGINTEIAALLFYGTVRNIHENRRIDDFGFNRVDVFAGAFINFLRGIATIKGINYIDSMLPDIDKKLK